MSYKKDSGINTLKSKKGSITGIVIETTTKWYTRLWYLISNLFLYLFKGKLRY